MSAIAGIYSRRGLPIDRKILQRLGRALELLGSDDERSTFTDRVAMLHRPFHVDRESRFTPQPLSLDDGTLLCWDGRLDNRGELRRLYGDELPPSPRTLDFFLFAYRKWGVEGFARLIGDFALALWDPRQNHLVLAADSMGLCPLYHYTTADFVVFSSSARALVEVLDLGLDLDEDFIADFLSRPNPSEHSPFRRVRAIPGGHALVVGPEGSRLRRYWKLDPGYQVRYGTDEEYEEHFREVFGRAVACRMNTDGPIFAEMSGGLDSSSIVCVGDRLLEQGRVTTPAMHTVSYVYDTSPAADERPYMRLVEEQRQQPGIHVRDEDWPILGPLPANLRTDLPSSQIGFHGRRTALVREMKARGARVVLRGEVGDQVLWGEIGYAPYDLADHLRQGRLLTLARSCQNWSRLLRSPFGKVFWQGACWPLLPRRLRAMSFYLEPRAEWLDQSWARRVELEARRLGPEDDVGFRLPSDREQYSLIRAGVRHYALQMYSAEGHVEARYPFLDRRLIEFAMAIPVGQKLRLGDTRSIMRRALRGILPEGVRTRQTKGGPTQALQRALVREWPWLSELLVEPRVCDHGIVDRGAFAATMQRARHGVVSHPSLLLRTLSLELWLRSFEADVASDVQPRTVAL